jgi:hypothetical protein
LVLNTLSISVQLFDLKNFIMKKIYLLFLAFMMINSFLFSQEKEEFKPSGKVLVDVFGDYYYKLAADADSVLSGDGEYQKTTKDFNAFAFRRIYLGYEYNITEKFYANVTLEGTDALKLGTDQRGASIKFAYFEWKEILPGSKLVVGAQKTTIWEAPEKVWGQRAVEKTIADFRKIGASNDVGIALTGRIGSKGIFGYHAMIANGTAQKVEKDKYKKFYGTLTGNFIDKKLIVELHANYEKVDNSSNNTVAKAFVGFENKKFAVGLEEVILVAKENSSTTTSAGSSLFARFSIIENKLSAFVRGDLFNENLDETSAGNTESFTIFGIDFKPIKQIDIIPNLWISTYNSKDSNIDNRKPDVVARVTFRYKL